MYREVLNIRKRFFYDLFKIHHTIGTRGVLRGKEFVYNLSLISSTFTKVNYIINFKSILYYR